MACPAPAAAHCGHACPTHSTCRLPRLRYSATTCRLESARRSLGDNKGFDRYRQTSFDMITSPRCSAALDVTREPRAVRERYGYTLFGQGGQIGPDLSEADRVFCRSIDDRLRARDHA